MSEQPVTEPTTAGPDANATPAAVIDPPPSLQQVESDVAADVHQAEHDTVAGVEQTIATDKADLHPAAAEVLQFFNSLHLPQHLAQVAQPFKDLAHHLAATLKGNQLVIALHHLLAAKDSAVRAKLAETGSDSSAKTPGEPPAA